MRVCVTIKCNEKTKNQQFVFAYIFIYSDGQNNFINIVSVLNLCKIHMKNYRKQVLVIVFFSSKLYPLDIYHLFEASPN